LEGPRILPEGVGTPNGVQKGNWRISSKGGFNRIYDNIKKEKEDPARPAVNRRIGGKGKRAQKNGKNRGKWVP